MLYTILFTLLIVAICMLLLGVSILFKKGGKFPNGHVSNNKKLRKNGVHCVQAQDREEQQKRKFSIDELEKSLYNRKN